jgi:uncharacterized protein (TIGR00252 family)
MSTTKTGRNAESLVAEKLKNQGHKIIELNWRTRWCEIDIVSKYKDIIYFTEVKFRSSDIWGDGLSYITKTKLKQINFAADFWISNKNWLGDCVLQVASVSAIDEITFVEL